ncbi:MAG TPA: hypothetical protein VFU71_18230 [Burkholderiaceae bacterium]|nr:hypothetical protein [Burkholderiaceae bacterium]
MSFAVTASAAHLNTAVFDKPLAHELTQIPFPPPPPDPTAVVGQVGATLRQAADDYCGTVFKHIPLPLPKGGDDNGWCGTVPRHFPPLPPKGGDDSGWCGTVPHRLPFPPPPPQPWVDLANLAQSFR